MKTKKIDRIRQDADQVQTLEQFIKDKDRLVQRIATVHIQYNGFYTCIVDGVKTFVQP